MTDKTVLSELAMVLPGGECAIDAPLRALGRWRIGGLADAVVTPGSRRSLATTLRFVNERGLPYVLVGDGSNLLFDDAGFRGVIVRIGRAFGGFTADDSGRVTAGAGLWMPSFVRATIARGLSGAIHAIGIPGTLGGLVVMNGGSQRRGIGEHVVTVEVMDRTGQIRRLERSALDFAYRRSALQDGTLVVVSADFAFPAGDRGALRREAIDLLASRRAKFPKVRANCGSVFVSDPKLYALIGPPGMAIEQAGLKGLAAGDAQISPDHANFIVNNGQARSRDVLSLIHRARDQVRALTGVAMEAEVRHLDPGGTLRPAHEVALAPMSGLSGDPI